jgi:phage terminase Nu1 subunit (DNA packaging protein)
MGRLLHALQARSVTLVTQWLRRYARACPDGDHDDQVTNEYLFTLIARDPLSPPTRYVAALELS